MKMSATEFASKCEDLARVLQTQKAVRSVHSPIYKSGITLYAYTQGYFGMEETFYVLNTDNGVIYTRHLDLDVKLKSSNEFLEVVNA